MITETAGIAPATARNERPQFFARMALIMAAIVALSFSVTYYFPIADFGTDNLEIWE